MADLNLAEIGYKLGVYFIPFLFALTFHEFCHGWVAKKLGDNTAEVMGRLTLNPTSHADVLGTFILPIMAIFFAIPFFGWAKPVPVDARNLKNPRTDMFWIALAGPLSNFFLAVVGAVLLAVLYSGLFQGSIHAPLKEMAQVFIVINLFLAFFNLIPLHPLDGGKVFARFFPRSWNIWLESNQNTLSMVLIGLFLIGGFSWLAAPVYLVANVLVSFSRNLSHFL
jgi:Zn-dependent protease